MLISRACWYVELRMTLGESTSRIVSQLTVSWPGIDPRDSSNSFDHGCTTKEYL